MTKEKAEKEFNEIVEKLNNKEITVKYGNYENKIELGELEINYNFADSINKACEIGRKNNIFINNYNIL